MLPFAGAAPHAATVYTSCVGPAGSLTEGEVRYRSTASMRFTDEGVLMEPLEKQLPSVLELGGGRPILLY